MKRVIISGATGAIGMALIKELLLHNVDILVLCHRGSKRDNRIPSHPLLERKYTSLSEFNMLENDTGKEYDVFFHLAWEGTIGQDRNNMFIQNRNVKYALDAVDLAKRFGCKKFIGVGSQAEYGRHTGILTPKSFLHPETGYGIGKLAAGFMTRELAHQNGMEHVWVRVLSIYGPNDGMQTMVMSTITKLKKGEVPKLTKCEQMWDYLFSEDAARAFYLLGDKGIDGKTYVLGSGKVRRLKQYVEDIREIVAPHASISYGALDYSPNQVMYLQADISSLISDIGWKPEVSFKDGIKRICDEIE